MLIYLASPYTHDDPWVRQERYEQALMAYVRLLQRDEFVFSPIVHSHYADRMLKDQKDHTFWMRQAIELLHRCDKVIVLMLDGWKQSKGVAKEIELAILSGLPVEYMEWPDHKRECMGT